MDECASELFLGPAVPRHLGMPWTCVTTILCRYINSLKWQLYRSLIFRYFVINTQLQTTHLNLFVVICLWLKF